MQIPLIPVKDIIDKKTLDSINLASANLFET